MRNTSRSAASSVLALVLGVTAGSSVEAGAASFSAAPGAATVPAAPGPAPLAGASTWVLRGSGWGHGLGMSQYGAMEMAKDGWSAARILRYYYTGTTYDAVADTQTLRVNILHAVPSLSASSVAISAGGGDFSVSVSSGATRTMTGGLGDAISLVRSGASVKVTCGECSGATSLSGPTVTLAWDTTAAADRTGMSIGGRVYRDGRTVIYPGAGSTLEVVNHVRLHDEYLDYIREMPWSWPKEALKAQAAAARGYALRSYTSGVRSACQCHVYDTTSDQVYAGYPAASDLPHWPAWRSAVRATGSSSTGYVVRSGGSVVRAYYSSSHGGRSENNEDVWGGTPLPYLRGVADPWSLRASNPRASWKLSPGGPTLAKAFGLSDIARLDLRDRTDNGGIRRAVAMSTAGAKGTITGEQFRTRVGVYSIAVRHLTRRFDGADRYAVGAAVAASVAPSATSVVIAAGDSTLVDAAVSGPLAGTLGAPLLLPKR